MDKTAQGRPKPQTREARLAAALRANLRRRKQADAAPVDEVPADEVPVGEVPVDEASVDGERGGGRSD